MNMLSLIGFVAAALTTAAYIPQAIKTIRTRQTKDISLWMYVMMSVGILLWLVYGIYNTDWPIILANCVTILLVIPILIIKILYR
jgi:Uncharacterized conserved protein